MHQFFDLFDRYNSGVELHKLDGKEGLNLYLSLPASLLVSVALEYRPG
jgi:hypothetical protein